MTLKEIMDQKRFLVLGNTLNPEKYAYKIKHELLKNGYEVYSCPKEIAKIDDLEEDFDVLDLCINPNLGMALLKESNRVIPRVLIQPGAISEEIVDYLNEKNIPYLEGCALVGLKLFPRKSK